MIHAASALIDIVPAMFAFAFSWPWLTDFAFVASRFAEHLRKSYWVKDESLTAVLNLADGLPESTQTNELADLIRKALVVTQGNRTNAAKLLEISHRALLYKIKDYKITDL